MTLFIFIVSAITKISRNQQNNNSKIKNDIHHEIKDVSPQAEDYLQDLLFHIS